MTPSKYRELRKRIGTQAAVAELLGVARETIARRETESDPITLEASLAMHGLCSIVAASPAAGKKKK